MSEETRRVVASRLAASILEQIAELADRLEKVVRMEETMKRFREQNEVIETANTRLREENARLKEALREIARQPLQEEVDEDDLERAAFDEGYDYCVRYARAAYKGGE